MSQIVVLSKERAYPPNRFRYPGARRIRLESNGTTYPESVPSNIYLPISSKSFNLVKRSRAEVPEFTSRMQDQWHPEGDNVALRINFTGYPKPTVTWFKDQQPIFATMKTMINLSEYSSELIIFQTEKSDNGFYSCRIENPLGIRETNAHIYVKCNERPHSLRVMPRKNHMSERLYKPMYHELFYYSKY
uniref:Ig-like domain-containing protein n=1 Tax=Rhabditophanes sp. KR3021 TaxID=114890 RepID=A0AC35U581_9BILA